MLKILFPTKDYTLLQKIFQYVKIIKGDFSDILDYIAEYHNKSFMQLPFKVKHKL